ncbi:hypothetical protein BAE30_12850 [Acidithiobacillus caldus]|uniref:Uncharacterized protein n=1 Tax=Acidithiobacillus caldus TaxID=33059 RepID=A0A1E7YSX3_9PROT|nr:hypothetical protein BAE30_12850 [Acidithiobacillus caldus]
MDSAATWIWVDRSPWEVFYSLNDKAGRSRDADQPLRPKIQIDRWLLEHWRLQHPERPGTPRLWDAFWSYYADYRDRLRAALPSTQTVCLPYEAEAIEGFLRDTIALWGGKVHEEPFRVRRYDGG